MQSAARTRRGLKDREKEARSRSIIIPSIDAVAAKKKQTTGQKTANLDCIHDRTQFRFASMRPLTSTVPLGKMKVVLGVGELGAWHKGIFSRNRSAKECS
jgi:hypothetical protein